MNWPKIISELIAAGKSQQEIADRAGVSQAAISKILASTADRSVRYETGAALIEFHAEVVLKHAHSGSFDAAVMIGSRSGSAIAGEARLPIWTSSSKYRSS